MAAKFFANPFEHFMITKLIRSMAVVWASPNTLIGMGIGVLALLTGGSVQYRRGCVEFYGGVVRWTLRQMLGGRGAAAMTLGHCILGQSTDDLRIARDHEHVHVAQYQRWGPFFLPAYLTWSLLRWMQGRDAYLDNPFEVEAYLIATPVEVDQYSDQQAGQPADDQGIDVKTGDNQTIDSPTTGDPTNGDRTFD